MAVPAVDSQFCGVMLVAERHRLHFRHIGFRNVGRTVDPVGNKAADNQQQKGAIDREPRDQVCTVVEYLRHDRRVLMSFRPRFL